MISKENYFFLPLSRECLEQGPTKANEILILHFNTGGTYIPNRS